MSSRFKYRFRRKARKLLRTPRRFFADMARNRMKDVEGRYKRIRGLRSKRRYSIISAVYGVESYLEDFFRSFEAQTLSFARHFELIMVDDGSPDGSADIIKRWQSKYPNVIRYVRKENGGQASARNAGLAVATGDWIAFVDPDDFIDARYFEYIDRFLDENSGDELAALSCNFIIYDEATDHKSNRHPLRYRFARGTRVVPIEQLHDDIQMSVNSVCFHGGLLRKSGIQFDERIRPSFEDAHFVNRFLLQNREKHIAFLKDAVYYYRKRSDGSSTLDLSWTHPGTHRDVLRYGCLDLLRTSSLMNEDGRVDRWIQRTVLYHLIWQIKRIVSQPHALAHLEEDGRAEFLSLLEEIFAYIDSSTIRSFNLAGAWLFHKMGILNLFGKEPFDFQHIYLTAFDESRRLLMLRYFTIQSMPEHSFFIDGEEVFPKYSQRIDHQFVDRLFIRENIAWFYIPDGAKTLSATVRGYTTRIVTLRKVGHAHVDLASAIKALTALPNPKGLSLRAQSELALSKQEHVRARFHEAFLFMDRDTHADDNAEHLYRYAAHHHPELNAFFVLRRDSHDWNRLEQEGFRLLEFGSLEHRLALLNAKHLISSHVDHYVVSHPTPGLTPFIRAKISFLQHGVTKDDLSAWLNSKNIAFLATASKAEFKAFVGGEYGYKFTEREVVLTGFARHDRLVASQGASRKQVLIMPTWRESLVGRKVGPGNARALNADFFSSEFAIRWKALLHSSELRRVVAKHGYEVVFFPHANLEAYVNGLEVPPYIRVMRPGSIGSIQELFLSSSVLITDYSSVAFEMAYLKKPVLYYQFDRGAVFNGAHSYRKGYFDYETDGFGPVCVELEPLLAELERAIDPAQGLDERYRERMERTFPFRDGKCCERNMKAILALDEGLDPVEEEARRRQQLGYAAQRATQAGDWPLAARRWCELLGLSGEKPSTSDAAVGLLEALREQGKLDQATEARARIELEGSWSAARS